MHILTLRTRFETFESKFEQFERDSKHRNPNSNRSKRFRSVYFCAIPSSSPVQNELSLTTPNFCFGTSVSKSKSGSYISLFVLELSLPNRKEKADLPQFVLEQIEKPRTFRFGTCPPNWIHNSIRNLVLKSKRPTSLLHKSLSNPNRNPEQKFCFQVGYSCHEGSVWSVYFCAIPSSSPVQNELSLTTPNFSLFVLELPFPNRKAEVIFHYSFWNFRSQIEKWKSYFTIRFGTFAPKSKRES